MRSYKLLNDKLEGKRETQIKINFCDNFFNNKPCIYYTVSHYSNEIQDDNTLYYQCTVDLNNKDNIEYAMKLQNEFDTQKNIDTSNMILKK